MSFWTGCILTYALSRRSYWVQELYREIFFLKHRLLWHCQCGMEYSSCFYSWAPLDIWKTYWLFQLLFWNVQQPLTNQQKNCFKYFVNTNWRLKKNLPQDTDNFYLRWPLLHMEQWLRIPLYNLYLISMSLSFLTWIMEIIPSFQTGYDSSVAQHLWNFQYMATTWWCEWPFLYKARGKKTCRS